MPIYCSYAVRNLQVGSSHVYSPTIKGCHLDLGDQMNCNVFVNIPNKAEAPTRFSQRIADDLGFFDLAILLKVLLEALVGQLVVQATYEHLVFDSRVDSVAQLGQLLVMTRLIKIVFSSLLLVSRFFLASTCILALLVLRLLTI